MDTPIIRTLRNVPLVSVLARFHCDREGQLCVGVKELAKEQPKFCQQSWKNVFDPYVTYIKNKYILKQRNLNVWSLLPPGLIRWNSYPIFLLLSQTETYGHSWVISRYATIRKHYVAVSINMQPLKLTNFIIYIIKVREYFLNTYSKHRWLK